MNQRSAASRSWFVEDERAGWLDFWQAYDASYHDVSRAMDDLLAASPFATVMPRGELSSSRETSRSLVRAGIEGDWTSYEEYLRTQAAHYANLGLTFDGWHLMVRAVADVVASRLIQTWSAEPPRLEAALRALRRFNENVLVILTATFIGVKENALRRSSARKTALLKVAIDAIIFVNHEGLIVELNPAAERIFGYTREEAIGADLAELIIPPSLRASHRAGFARAMTTNSSRILGTRVEMPAMRKGGTEFPCEIVITRVPQDGPPLFTGFIRDVTAEKRTREALSDSEQRLRNWAARLQSAIEEERTRIAREIHDELGQQLTALKLDLAWVMRRLEAGDLDTVTKRLRAMTELVDTTVGMVRRLATGLRPGVLDDLGLCAALEWQAREFEARAGIDVAIHLPEEEELGIPSDHATALFRLFQEMLTNVMRHAGATNVLVRLERNTDDVVLQVSDDGRGITASEASRSSSLGLVGMRERVGLLGGVIEIEGKKGKGTLVTVRIPLPANAT